MTIDQLRELFRLLGDRWTLCVLHELFLGPQRFGGLKRAIAGVSQRMLSVTLVHLTENGLVARTVIEASHVSYSLTPEGFALFGKISKFRSPELELA